MILNSPSNPTGCAYTEEELQKIADIAIEKNLLVISDEIYERIVYDGFRCVSIASLGRDQEKDGHRSWRCEELRDDGVEDWFRSWTRRESLRP